MDKSSLIPPVTILIEWENAIDVTDEWTAKAMKGLETELESYQGRLEAPPRVLYLYDKYRVDEQVIRNTVNRVTPKLPQLCQLEFIPTPGLTYYKLKNHGASLTKTEFVVMLDSDAAPQPGWLPNLLAPFADPEVMAVGGFTVLGYNDLLSRVFALIWIFHLRGDREVTLKRHKINANNCAFRTSFFQANPWPDLPAFKKQCGFWLRDIERRGIRWVRTADAMTVHAPHPGYAFVLWRAWTAGSDRDYQAFEKVGNSHLRRLGFATWFWLKRCARSTQRIVFRGHEVELPVWQIPAALLIAYGYWTTLFVNEVITALTKTYEPLEEVMRPKARTAGIESQAPAVADTAAGHAVGRP